MLISRQRSSNPSPKSRSLEQLYIWLPTPIDWFRTGVETCTSMAPFPIETSESTPKADTSNMSEFCPAVCSSSRALIGLRSILVDTMAEFGVEWILCHRVDVQAELHRLAIRPDGPGEPAKVVLNSRVVDCDPEQGTVTLKDGTVMTAGVIIGTYPVLYLESSLIPSHHRCRWNPFRRSSSSQPRLLLFPLHALRLPFPRSRREDQRPPGPGRARHRRGIDDH